VVWVKKPKWSPSKFLYPKSPDGLRLITTKYTKP
jgi:hypothetical protein